MARKSPPIPDDPAKETEAPPPPAYFLSLTVENVRCFGPTQTLDLSDGKGRPRQWTVLLGDNGVGKTTVLECLEGVTVSKVSVEDGGKPRLLEGGRRENWISVTRDIDRGDISCVAVSHAKLEAGTEVPMESSNISVSIHENFTTSVIEHWKHVAEFQAYAYGANRLFDGSVAIPGYDLSPSGTHRTFGTPLLDPSRWLLQLDYTASKPSPIQDQAARRRDQVRQVLIELLPEIDDVRITTPSKEQPNPRVEFQTPYGWVPLDALSLGYKTMVGWMVDLAARLFDRYPESPNPLAEPAIVLVDEIDLHMHPRWQRQIMAYLSARFPNTQFVVTAHSPLIVQAAVDANVAVLRREGDHVVIDNRKEAVRGWRIDQVLASDLFGLENVRTPDLDEPLRRRRELLSKARLSGPEETELKELEARIGGLPTGESAEDREAMELICRAARRLKEVEG